MKDLNVVVVGAGIGGLQTALALAKDGHSVTVLESAKAFEEVCIPLLPQKLFKLDLVRAGKFATKKREDHPIPRAHVSSSSSNLYQCPFPF